MFPGFPSFSGGKSELLPRGTRMQLTGSSPIRSPQQPQPFICHVLRGQLYTLNSF